MGGAAVGLGPLLALRKVSFFQNSSDFFLTEEEIYNAGAVCLIPESEITPGEGNGSPLQCSRLENPMDRRAWPAIDLGVAKELDTT